MEPVDTDIAVPRGAPPTLADRVKPRLSARTQLLLAGVLWYAVAVALGTRGIGWLVGAEWAFVLAAAGVLLGLLKARFIMERVAKKAIGRIRERDRDKCAGGFFSWQSWLVVLGMMALGHALRLTATPRPLLGALYVAIATGLLVAGRLYWIAASRPASVPSDPTA
jgi:hypothetical protein